MNKHRGAAIRGAPTAPFQTKGAYSDNHATIMPATPAATFIT